MLGAESLPQQFALAGFCCLALAGYGMRPLVRAAMPVRPQPAHMRRPLWRRILEA
jgi:hypothetical protein